MYETFYLATEDWGVEPGNEASIGWLEEGQEMTEKAEHRHR